jgi:cell wall-associated NlpC family hydrolase
MRRTLVITCIMLVFAPATARAAATSPSAKPVRPAAHVTTVGDLAVQAALRLRGAPYVYGGSSPAGFDCSGFTSYVYGKLGIDLAHSSYDQWTAGRHVARSDLEPGDLVFFYGLGHVGMYVGHGLFIHAPHTGTVVSLDRLSGSWYGPGYVGAVRVHGTQQPAHVRAEHRSARHAQKVHRARRARRSRPASPAPAYDWSPEALAVGAA